MRTARLVRFPLALATLLGFTLLAWLAITTAVHANPFTVSATGGSVVVGSNITSTVTLTPTGSEQVGGAVVDVTTPSNLSVVSCAGATGVIANCNYNSTGNVRFVFGQITPFSGQVGTITYHANSVGTGNVGVTATQCASVSATPLDCTATGTATGTPPATSLPTTGGSTGSGSSTNWALPLFIIAGLALVTGSAAWTLHRARSR